MLILKITNNSKNNGKHCGDIIISVFEDKKTGFHFFKIKADNDNILPVSYIIEDTLKLY